MDWVDVLAVLVVPGAVGLMVLAIALVNRMGRRSKPRGVAASREVLPQLVGKPRLPVNLASMPTNVLYNLDRQLVKARAEISLSRLRIRVELRRRHMRVKSLNPLSDKTGAREWPSAG